MKKYNTILIRHTFITWILRVNIALLILYLLLLIFAPKIQGYALFPGMAVNTLEHTQKQQEQLFGKNTEYISFQDNSGERVSGIYMPGSSQEVFYFFHGNGGSLEYFTEFLSFIHSLGYGVLAVEYPGYGNSTGFADEKSIMRHAQEFYKEAQKVYGIKDQDLILGGFSIGTGVATQFAQYADFKGLVLLASYQSCYELSQQHYNYVVQKVFFLPNCFQTQETLGFLSLPKLLIHGSADTLVSLRQGENNFLSARDPKYWVELPRVGHNDLLSAVENIPEFKDFLKYQTIDKEEIEQIELRAFLQGLDVESDSSYQKYVDPYHPFDTLGYIPKDMRALSRTFIVDTKGDAQMRELAAENFEAMAEQFYRDTGEKMVVVSSYRSYAYQAGIKAGGCPDNLCAKAGYSEHQSGLTADLWSASSNEYWKSSARLMGYYAWLKEHAAEYGFHNPYQNGVSIDGYDIEPWHWRYMGPELALYLQKQDMTFAEFFMQRENDKK